MKIIVNCKNVFVKKSEKERAEAFTRKFVEYINQREKLNNNTFLK